MAMILLTTTIACDRSAPPDQRPSEPAPVEEPITEPVIALNVQPPDSAHVRKIANALKELNVSHIRVSWWAWSDSASWEWLFHFRESGIEVLPLVYADRRLPPEEWGASIAARYRQLFEIFEGFPYVQLENELDGDGPFGITEGRDPCLQGRRWAEQTRIAVEALRAFDDSVRIVSMGIAWNREGVEEFVRCYVIDAPIDVLAIHVYGVHLWGEPLSRWQRVRSAGWNGPVWATELGVSDTEAKYAGADPDAWQLENVRGVFEDPNRLGFSRLYFFQLCCDDKGWSLLRYPGWEPRPAYEWLKNR